jgi:AGCS family alanine or glycine:cation symporter
MIRNARVVAALLVAFLLAPTAAWGQAAPQERTLWENADAAFATYVVGPFATVLFFDLMFWDNTLPPGTGVGNYVEADGKRWLIQSYDENGYVYRPVTTAPRMEVIPKLVEPITRDVGKIRLHLELEGGQIMARPTVEPYDAVAIGVPLDPKATEHRMRLVTGVSIVPIVVDVATGRVVGFVPGVPNDTYAVSEEIPADLIRVRTAVPADTLPLAAGMRALTGGREVEVASVTDDVVEVVELESRIDPAPRANPDQQQLPAVVVWLVCGALFFTLRMGFVNVRAFGHAVAVTAGKYDKAGDPGEVSHFQALSSALSATVGLGNIAGVAIAVAAGGPGAVVWMIVAALLGMTSKFVECTLGVMYREVRPDGTVSGGPMHYLDKGLEELGLGWLGKVLAVVFALMCVGGSLGGGNMFQANQTAQAIGDLVPATKDYAWAVGLVLAVLVGVVILGGIKRIAQTAGVIVPVMCGVYLVAGAWILASHAADVPAAFGVMLEGAFTAEGVQGGVLGVIVQGFRRASFSNEAGIGSASIAHAAAATDEPVREGIVALLEPFIDTVIVCTMTGLVVVVTGAYLSGDTNGVVMTSRAFASVLPWFPVVLTVTVVLFAYSTMISWSYYGERCATWMLGQGAALPYRVLFLVCVVYGSAGNAGSVLDFSDLMVLGMAFPNILGCVLLSGKVKRALDAYLAKLKSGAFARA